MPSYLDAEVCTAGFMHRRCMNPAVPPRWRTLLAATPRPPCAHWTLRRHHTPRHALQMCAHACRKESQRHKYKPEPGSPCPRDLACDWYVARQANPSPLTKEYPAPRPGSAGTPIRSHTRQATPSSAAAYSPRNTPRSDCGRLQQAPNSCVHGLGVSQVKRGRRVTRNARDISPRDVSGCGVADSASCGAW